MCESKRKEKKKTQRKIQRKMLNPNRHLVSILIATLLFFYYLLLLGQNLGTILSYLCAVLKVFFLEIQLCGYLMKNTLPFHEKKVI